MIEKYYKEQVLGETPQEALDLQDILKKSAELHEALRNYGQLGDKEKPLIVSAILLALREDSFEINSLTGDTLKTDGQKIYDALSTHMDRVDVKTDSKKQQVIASFNIVKSNLPLNEIDERLGKTPIKYFAEYIQKMYMPAWFPALQKMYWVGFMVSLCVIQVEMGNLWA